MLSTLSRQLLIFFYYYLNILGVSMSFQPSEQSRKLCDQGKQPDYAGFHACRLQIAYSRYRCRINSSSPGLEPRGPGAGVKGKGQPQASGISFFSPRGNPLGRGKSQLNWERPPSKCQVVASLSHSHISLTPARLVTSRLLSISLTSCLLTCFLLDPPAISAPISHSTQRKSKSKSSFLAAGIIAQCALKT